MLPRNEIYRRIKLCGYSETVSPVDGAFIVVSMWNVLGRNAEIELKLSEQIWELY
jgi:hypothetical protein